MCMTAKVPETMGSRAQEDFFVACRTIDPEYGTSGLRALIDLCYGIKRKRGTALSV
jgi:hypothetical protein